MKKVLILILAVILSLSVFAMAACQQPCETHVDGNHDGICDVCEETGLSVAHTDTNHDGKCDGCGATTTFEHVDAAHDGKCDVCNQDVEVIHVDADGDGYCDVTACGHKYEWVDALADAKEYVDGLYLRGDEITAVDFEITTVVSIGGVKYNVDWEIQSTVAGQTAVALGEIDSTTKQQKVNVDEFSAQEVAYKLVATVSDAEGHSVKVEYARKVPQFVVSSYEDYLAHCKAADGVSFTIRAYVIGAVSVTSSSKGSLYLQDADGNGYYAYAPSLPADATASEEALDAYFPFGTEVCVTGTGTVYGGQYEFNKGCQIVKTGNVATAEQLPFENVTEVWGSAKNQGDHDVLMQDQNKLVVLEEAVFTKADDKYYYFTVNGVQFNIYKTNYFMADQADIDALFAKFEVGKAATIKGIVSCYSNLYQIYPLDVECISNVHTPELNDAQKVEFELGNLQLPETITEAGAIQLPAVGSTYETVSITWALKETYACATIADGKLNVTLPSEATTITVVATLTLNGETETKEIEITVASSFAMSEVHAYVGYVNQVTAGKQLYLDGGVSGRYLTTTTDASKAVSVYAEKAEGGYKLYILVDGTKQYITIYANSEGKDSVNYDANGTTVYAYNPVVNAFTTNFNGKDKYLGTYNSFETISVSNLSYINAENTGVSQFPLEILPVADGASYSASVTQVKLEGKVLYLDGGVSGRYLTTTEDLSKAVVIYAEKVDGGYKFYKLNGTTKEYITIYANSEGKDSVNYDAAGNTVFNYDPVVNAWTTFFAGKDKYLGTYNTFNTISVSNLSYITAENTGVSQFPLVLAPYVAGGPVVPPVEEHKCESVCPTCGKCLDEDCAEAVCAEKCEGHEIVDNAPVAGTYILEMYQSKKGENYYFTGTMSGYYFATSTNKADAVEITLAKLENGKYTMKLANGKYIAIVASGTHLNAVMQDAVCEWTWNAEIGSFTAQAGSEVAFLGTYGDYSTIGGSKLSYASTSYVAKLVATAVVPPVEEPAVVINGQNYTEAQAEEALLALKAGDVVEIRTNGTIAKEYTFVAANYTLGEGAVLTIQANAVAPAGAKLTVGAKSVIVVESGATIDISALTQDDFATSTEARLEIANGATVIMPAYTEALWNDAYLKVVIEAMVADSEVGAKLVLGETKLTKTASGWEAEAPVLEDVAVNVTELAAGQLAANTELVAGSGIYTTTPSKDDGSKLVIDSSKKSIDGFDFTLRLKFGGTMKVADGVVTDGLKLEVKGAATITVYAMSSSSGSDRVLQLATLADDAFTTVGEQTALGASIAKLTYEVSAAGTYYLGSTNSGINVYYVAINYVAPAHTCESVCPECGKCLDAACTESACAEKCEGHKPAAVTATISFADKANRTVFTTSQQVWVQNGITITNNKAASTSNVADYAKPARFYASSELIVEAEGQITEIVFHCNSGKPAISLGTIEGATVTKDGYVVTVTFETPVDSFTVAKLSAQVRMDSIDVTYIPA